MVATMLEHMMHALFGNQPLQGAGPAAFPTRQCATWLNFTKKPKVDKMNQTTGAPILNPAREALCRKRQQGP